MTTFDDFLNTHQIFLTEGSIFERLRRVPGIPFDQHIATAGLLYDPAGAKALAQVHRSYLDVAQKYRLPMLVQTDTWRAGCGRIEISSYHDRQVNQDNVRFMREIRAEYPPNGPQVFIAGMVGPYGDSYQPAEAPSEAEAMRLHDPQVNALAASGIDLFLAPTFPAFPETLGLARLMAVSALPYIISYVLRPTGTLLDGTPLSQAIETIDNMVARPPAGYAINCVYPTIFQTGLQRSGIEEKGLTGRVLGLQANASTKSPEELAQLTELDSADPQTLAADIFSAGKAWGAVMLGGCCGTDERHIAALAENLLHNSWSISD